MDGRPSPPGRRTQREQFESRETAGNRANRGETVALSVCCRFHFLKPFRRRIVP